MKMSMARPGSMGNRKLLSKYGGSPGSGPSGRQHYAKGGAVHAPKKAFADGGMVDGDSAPKRLDRPGRKMKGKDKGKKGTNINVVVMAGKGDQPGGPPGGPPMPPMAGPPPMPPKPMMPPPGPPMGPGGPPMGMHKHGGKVKAFAKGGKVGKNTPTDAEGPYDKFKKGGRVKKDDGGPVMTDARRANVRNEIQGNMQGAVEKITGKATGGQVTPSEKEAERADGGFKKGGKVMMKHHMKHRAMGGSVKMGSTKGDGDLGKLSMKSQKGDGDMSPGKGESMGSKGTVKMTAGAGGAEGRLEKMKAYGRSKGGKC